MADSGMLGDPGQWCEGGHGLGVQKHSEEVAMRKRFDDNEHSDDSDCSLFSNKVRFILQFIHASFYISSPIVN